MNKIILFRFHSNIEIAIERINLLKRFNPDKHIHGLFGGKKSESTFFEESLRSQLSSFTVIDSEDPKWKWLHIDLTLKEWYRKTGKNIEFDFLYDIEWDMLLLDSLDNIYPKILDQNSIALNAYEPIDNIRDNWDWTSEEPDKSKFLKFERYMNKKFGIEKLEFASLGPWAMLSKDFVDEFSNTEDNDLVLGEIAFPAYAQALKYNVIEAGLHPGWYDEVNEIKFFNAMDESIRIDSIKEELKKPNGRRAFHPVKYLISDLIDL